MNPKIKLKRHKDCVCMLIRLYLSGKIPLSLLEVLISEQINLLS